MKNVTDLLKSKAQRQMVTVKPEDTVLDAIKLLAKEDVGAAVIVSGGQLVGIFPSATTRGRSSSRGATRRPRASRRS